MILDLRLNKYRITIFCGLNQEGGRQDIAIEIEASSNGLLKSSFFGYVKLIAQNALINNRHYNFIIRKMDQNCKEDIKTRDSSKTTRSPLEEKGRFSDLERKVHNVNSQYRLKLFETTVEGMDISQKTHQKAVSWLITICWIKNLSQDCLWQTLLLYYSYRAKKHVSKSQLQLILLACLSLAIKMTSNKIYSTKEIASLSNQSATPTEIIDMELVILQLVDYNLVIPHQLEELFFVNELSEEQLNEILLVSELLMIKDYTIFVDGSKLRGVLELLSDKELDKSLELFGQLKELLCLKESKAVLSKYSSKMDIHIFKEKFM